MGVAKHSGLWTVILAVIHVAMTPVFYGRSLRSLLEGGVVGAADAGGDAALAERRAPAFWYLITGLFLGLVGLAVWGAERRGEGAPRGFALAMAVTGAWGALLSPRSGFWLFLPIAWLARRHEVRRPR